MNIKKTTSKKISIVTILMATIVLGANGFIGQANAAVINCADLPTPPDCPGTNQADQITGRATADNILGFAGVDTINAQGGNDKVVGFSGADAINGGVGDDSINAGAQADTVNGDAGDDGILGGGGTGADTLNGGPGEDTLYGLAGVDVLNGGTEEDFLFGGAGDGDRLEGGPGGDGYNCGEGIGDIVIGFNPAEGDYYMDEQGTDLATVDAAAKLAAGCEA